MDILKIYTQLSDSLKNFRIKKGEKLTKEEITTDIINNACLGLLKARRENKLNILHEDDLTGAYLACAKKLFPDINIAYTHMAIQQNLDWDEMWNFLRQYFRDKHQMSIDDVNSLVKKFISKRQERYENNELTVTGHETKEAIIEYLTSSSYELDAVEALISIPPNLTSKSAEVYGGVANIVILKKMSEGYIFEVHGVGEIEKIVVRIEPRNLKFIYYKD